MPRALAFFIGVAGFAAVTHAAPEDPRLAWGRAQLDATLFAEGYVPGAIAIEARVDANSPRLPATARKPEGFFLGTAANRIEVIGFDAAGALYGMLEAAEQVRDHGELPAGLDIADQPAMTQRASCILLMRLGDYNFAVSPKEFPFFYDKQLWTAWLDEMARMRFNALTLWNGHPFAYFVKFDRFTEAQDGMEPGLIERNNAMLHWLVDEAGRRNIRLLFEFYNIHTSVYFQRAHDLPDENRVPTPLLRDYTSYAVERFVREFPEVGLYITPGEAIELEYTDTWVNDVLFPAIERGGSKGPVWLRAWGIDLPHARKVADRHPDVWFERKYNVEMIARDQADPANRDWAALDGHHVVNIHMASEIGPFRWWPPSYIQRCVQSAVATGADGLHLYPRQSWRWPGGVEPDLPQLQWKRDRMWFETWARYAWNPDRPAAGESRHWTMELAAEFGNREAAGKLLAAQETLADVLPSIQRLVWLGYDNHTVVSSGIKLSQLEKAPGIPDQPLPEVAQRIPEFLATVRKGATTPSPTPEDFLNSRVQLAAKALDLARAGADVATRNPREGAALVRDAQATSMVARFYALKLRAAVLRAQAEAPGSTVAKDAFLEPLGRSLALFRELADLTRGHYASISDVPATNPVRLKKVPYHWDDLVPLFERELSLYRRSLGDSGPPPSSAPDHAGLTGILYGDAGLRSPKSADAITTLSPDWSRAGSDRGQDWSAEWRGLLIWPRDGEVTIHVRANDAVTMELNGTTVLDGSGFPGEREITWSARRGDAVELRLTYDHPRRPGAGRLEVQWRIGGDGFADISAKAIRHSDRDATWTDEVMFMGEL